MKFSDTLLYAISQVNGDISPDLAAVDAVVALIEQEEN